MSDNPSAILRDCKAFIRSCLVSILVLACGNGAGDGAGVPDRAAVGEARTPPSLSEVGHSVITGIYEEPIQLRGAAYEGAPFVAGGASRPRVQLLDTYVTGDLDGAPGDEAVVILTETSGGSGVFAYVAVLTRTDSGIVNLGTALLGDRVRIREARVQDGSVVVDLLQAGSDDPLCCPTERATRTWRLIGGGLLEVTPDDR